MLHVFRAESHTNGWEVQEGLTGISVEGLPAFLSLSFYERTSVVSICRLVRSRAKSKVEKTWTNIQMMVLGLLLPAELCLELLVTHGGAILLSLPMAVFPVWTTPFIFPRVHLWICETHKITFSYRVK